MGPSTRRNFIAGAAALAVPVAAVPAELAAPASPYAAEVAEMRRIQVAIDQANDECKFYQAETRGLSQDDDPRVIAWNAATDRVRQLSIEFDDIRWRVIRDLCKAAGVPY